jgi:hypothetical protein
MKLKIELNLYHKKTKNSAPKLKSQLEEQYGKIVCVETIRKVIRSYGYNGHPPRKTPFIKKNG